MAGKSGRSKRFTTYTATQLMFPFSSASFSRFRAIQRGRPNYRKYRIGSVSKNGIDESLWGR